MAATQTTKPTRDRDVRTDSDAPKSGVRLVAPLRVPRPPVALKKVPDGEDTYVDNGSAAPPPVAVAPLAEALPKLPALRTIPPAPPTPAPSSRRAAAVRPRGERRRGTVTPSDRGAANSNAIAAQTFRPLISTAVDWPIAKPPADSAAAPESSRLEPAPQSIAPVSVAPTFGLELPDARASLPAFVPPADLLAESLSSTSALVSLGTLDVETSEDDALELARGARRTKLLGFLIGVVAALGGLAIYAFTT
jgi:hypothetical protein